VIDDVQPPEVVAGEKGRDELVEAADGLKNEVARLRLAVEQLGRRQDQTEKVSTRTALLAGVLAALVLFIGFVAWQQSETADDVRATQERLGTLTQQSLCPTFALLLGGYDPSTRAEGAARQQYIATFDRFRAAYDALGCIGPVVPPRTDR